jgi:hypothetical protein
MHAPTSAAAVCANLATALGDEWEAALQHESQRATRRQRAANAPQSQRQVQRAPGASPSFAAWRYLPSEMRAAIIEQLADQSPASILALYGSDREDHDLINAMRHPLALAGADGRLAWTTVPLIEYARLAVALGQNDPLRMFLAAALCTLLAVADAQVDAFRTGRASLTNREPPAPRQVRFDDPHLWRLVPDVYWPHPDPAMLIMRGLSPAEYRQFIPEFVRARPDAVRSIGPLRGSLEDIVRQWLDWVTLPNSALADRLLVPLSDVASRYETMANWSADPYRQASFCRTGLTNAVAAGPPGSNYIDPCEQVPHLLGAVSLEQVDSILGDVVPPSDLREWLGSANLDRRAPVSDRIQQAIAELGPGMVAHRIAEAVADQLRVHDLLYGRMCRGDSARMLAPFKRLFANSVFWIRPGDPAAVYANLRSPALEEALNAASVRSLAA